MASKLLHWVILGPPSSGKGTVCERIAQNFGLQHLSSSHFLRENLKASTVGDTAKQYLQKDLLVPDHVITQLMVSELETRSTRNWLLDGFLRTLVQAESLNRICDVDLVISLNIPFVTLKDHLSRRWIHPSSRRVYNVDFNTPQVLGLMTSLVNHLSNKKMINLKQLLSSYGSTRMQQNQLWNYTRAEGFSTSSLGWRLTKYGLMFTHFSQTRSHLFNPKKHTEPTIGRTKKTWSFSQSCVLSWCPGQIRS
ncbi:Adenylate kinase isoenzyme 4, mitochondrial [Cricetulus griseus]|uniref:Adenylate kinase isoenzyme 4, mitochondrial n=1 Tax=Cricetulus griseus TaxID=10029 RepID=G3IGT9_CRIGR|nr:Adenylate kinase isoenzyme 4, mitochondrial [Cricetulus griseus]